MGFSQDHFLLLVLTTAKAARPLALGLHHPSTDARAGLRGLLLFLLHLPQPSFLDVAFFGGNQIVASYIGNGLILKEKKRLNFFLCMYSPQTAQVFWHLLLMWAMSHLDFNLPQL